MNAPRDELRQRLEAALLKAGIAEADRASVVVAELFYKVRDSWDEINITTISTDGRSSLHQRSLVAEWPVQAIRFDQIADRRVEEEPDRG